MYLLLQARQLLGFVNENVLERNVRSYKAEHPEADDQEVYSHILRLTVPPQLALSPQWHRAKLRVLTEYVHKFGFPHLFVTLTSDESSPLRWEECVDLDALLSQLFGDHLSWRDAPTECARLFHARVEALMQKYVLGGPRLLGRVLDYVIHYEEQSRGSMHAHILVWLHADDVDVVSDSIVACLPPKTAGMSAAQSRMRDTVEFKHQHACRPVCVEGGRARCKRGFPFAPHYGGTVFDAALGRFIYYRPGPEHAWTVPSPCCRCSSARTCAWSAW